MEASAQPERFWGVTFPAVALNNRVAVCNSVQLQFAGMAVFVEFQNRGAVSTEATESRLINKKLIFLLL